MPTNTISFQVGVKFEVLVPNYKLGCQTLHLEPILPLFNLQLQRQRCSRLERFISYKNIFNTKNALRLERFISKKNIFTLKTR
jgi:hypothetical protein